MKAEYRKALNQDHGCDRCGHHIGLVINESYQCDYCGFIKKSNKVKNDCLCWISKDICPVHMR